MRILVSLITFCLVCCFQATAAPSIQSQGTQIPLSAAIEPKAIGKVDLVVVKKSARVMHLMRKGEVVRQYHIAMGDRPEGHKLTEGDQRTPEGRYLLDYKKSDSAYYRAIHISYPNAEDRLRASALGLDPGGQIMIHGQNPNSNLSPAEAQKLNWTDGCIAIKNHEMDELWHAIELNTPIEIWP